MSTFEKIVSAVLLFLFLLVLGLFLLYSKLDKTVKEKSVTEVTNVDTTQPVDISIAKKQIEILEASSEALLKRVEELEQTEPTTKVITSTAQQIFQKQIVHIGSTSTKENDWTNSGIEVTLNSADYPANVDAVFEVGVSIVSGVGSARLVNKTTGAIMNVTEVSAGTSETTWRSSPKFKLHSGSNVYEVQVRSSSGEVANFSSARITLTD